MELLNNSISSVNSFSLTNKSLAEGDKSLLVANTVMKSMVINFMIEEIEVSDQWRSKREIMLTDLMKVGKWLRNNLSDED